MNSIRIPKNEGGVWVEAPKETKGIISRNKNPLRTIKGSLSLERFINDYFWGQN